MTETLIDCPFCSWHKPRLHENDPFYQVKCHACGAACGNYRGRSRAIEAWNSRAPQINTSDKEVLAKSDAIFADEGNFLGYEESEKFIESITHQTKASVMEGTVAREVRNSLAGLDTSTSNQTLIGLFKNRLTAIGFAPEGTNWHDAVSCLEDALKVSQCEMLDNKPLSREEAARFCDISIRKHEDGSYGYSHSGMLPFDDVFKCLKRQGWEPKREIVDDNWQRVKTAPYEKAVLVCTGSGYVFPAVHRANASINSDGEQCDAWMALIEGFCPPCWHDDQCWESNADGVSSEQPIWWRPMINSIEGEKS